ncbi:hypothetical protein SteCoe_31476 [Stentor coeruleus]|uniref:LITAF domain-containing protein n=1 Tax=Stentor coeruleus TaxID=5963 RepID=A0A1R2B150_9CILI|nr:hypothetical protein SteCoe_31476 [Stentor coeruleus]
MSEGISNDYSYPKNLTSNLSSSISSDLFPDYEVPQNDNKSSSSLQFSKSSMSHILDHNTMIINNNEHNYIFADDISIKSISNYFDNRISPNNEIPTETWRMSEAVTSAKESFVDGYKDKIYKENFNQSTFAIPNKMYCPQCECEVGTVVSFQNAEPNLLDRFEMFCQSFKCCVLQKIRINNELVHMCKVCRKILVRISTE